MGVKAHMRFWGRCGTQLLDIVGFNWLEWPRVDTRGIYNLVRCTIALEICRLHDYMENKVMDNSFIGRISRRKKIIVYIYYYGWKLGLVESDVTHYSLCVC